jgi:stage V sporulation protein G
VEITEVKIRLVNRGANRKLRAFCSVTIDNGFVIRDLKVIEGARGPFVAMPSRKLTNKCLRCGAKNALKANYCNECGSKLGGARIFRDARGRIKLHADVVHPITPSVRELFQKRIMEAYNLELERAKRPGYKPQEIYESPEEYDEEVPEEQG